MTLELLSDQLARYLIDTAYKATFLLALGFIPWLVFRNRPAWQALVWTTVLIALVVLPISAVLLPGFEVPLIPRTHVAPPALDQDNVETANFRSFSASVPPHPVSEGTQDRNIPHTKWIPWAAALYLAGLCFSILKIGIGLCRMSRLRKVILPASADGVARINRWRARMGIKVPVNLGTSEKVNVPTVVGFRRPLIVIPGQLAAHKDVQTLDGILVHELAHIKRRDTFYNLLGLLAAAVYWYHPLVHLTRRWLAVTREFACDDWAVSIFRDRKKYSATLLEVTSGLDGHPALALSMDMARTVPVVRRVERILNLSRQITPETGRLRAAALIATIFAFSFVLGCMHPTHSRITPQGDSTPVGGKTMSRTNALRSIMPLFLVENLDTSTQFYIDKLGFEELYRGNFGGGFVQLRRDECDIFLARKDSEVDLRNIRARAPERADFASYDLHIVCQAGTIDALWHEYRNSGVQMGSGPEDRPYGVRDFGIHDPDGYSIVFGAPIESMTSQGDSTPAGGKTMSRTNALRSIMPLFLVENLDTSTQFYIDKLGFEELYRDNFGGGFVQFRRDECDIFLARKDSEVDLRNIRARAPERADFASYDLHIACQAGTIDALWHEYRDSGVQMGSGPEDRPYGVRDFGIHDPDGYSIVFGAPIE